MSSLPKGHVILDVETTISNDGNPFDQTNKLCYVGIHKDDQNYLFPIEYNEYPYASQIKEIASLLEDATCIVGFNLKFDLHWLRHYLPTYRPPRIWDCQLHEFIRSNQNHAYPSLDDTCKEYGIAGKVGDIAEKYWNQGIDTTEIPEVELRNYLANDLLITKDLYLAQLAAFTGVRRKLFLLHCMDELVLQEMEYNGLYYATEESLRRGGEVHIERERIVGDLARLHPEVGTVINWGSPDHVSAVLFGGIIRYPSTEFVERTLKSGAVKRYERKCVGSLGVSGLLNPKEHGVPETLPTSAWSNEELERRNAGRLAEGKPELSRVYSTAEDVLRNIRTRDPRARNTIRLLGQLATLKKLETTYFYGIPKLMEEMKWPPDKIHGQINQCRVITGRTSSSKPNLQNFDSVLKFLFYSRFPDVD